MTHATNKSAFKGKYQNACDQGYCPTKKEIENNEIKTLANRLRATTEKETLTSVLEWQNNNISYWFERFPLPQILIAFFVTSFIFGAQSLNPFFKSWWWITLILGTTSAALLAVTLLMISYDRKIPVRYFFKIFSGSLSIDFMLKYKLAVCRDYAKLTACLLANIYPNSDIYFVHAPKHVATGFVLENRLYILDKRLPIVTIDSWHKRWHTRKNSEKKVEKINSGNIQSVDISFLLSKTSVSELDTKKLSDKMAKRLHINQKAIVTITENSSLEIFRWRKGAILYEDNEIVNYSLARLLKKRIDIEILETNNLARIKAIQNKDDLVFSVVLL